MDIIGIVSIVGGAVLYIASAILTFKILEQSKANPVGALYRVVKGAVLGLVCAFVPPLLLLVNAPRLGNNEGLLTEALVAGFTLILPLVYLIVIRRADAKKSA